MALNGREINNKDIDRGSGLFPPNGDYSIKAYVNNGGATTDFAKFFLFKSLATG
ncbi:hypothetical protein [Neobacillus cucumis]|uniref:hypothetical protein n=1 Tax=Neobacillus cucumis TaxID=1740721 RepID=UPI0015E0D591|nr:hypothetical protein [Neobacillus cucumis]